jgi:hypothetical protein
VPVTVEVIILCEMGGHTAQRVIFRSLPVWILFLQYHLEIAGADLPSVAESSVVPKRQLEVCNNEMCGGFAGFACECSCEDGTLPSCLDNPFDNCDPLNGWSDCAGICICNACTGQRCGGGKNIPCDCNCPGENYVATCTEYSESQCKGGGCGGYCECIEVDGSELVDANEDSDVNEPNAESDEVESGSIPAGDVLLSVLSNSAASNHFSDAIAARSMALILASSGITCMII